jgi:hypothetical protein
LLEKSDRWKVRLSEKKFDVRISRPREIDRKGDLPMLRTILIAALVCASQIYASHVALAQELTAEQRNACMGDYEKYCKGTTPGGGRIIACLAKSNDRLTPECKKVLAAAEKK